ncbi:MAG: Ig-like domain-containing protein, partial [Trueperaceae bacterium]
MFKIGVRNLFSSLVFVVALATVGATAPAAMADGAMKVDCDAATAGVQDGTGAQCDYASGATFSIQIHVTSAPSGGYFGFQAKPSWTDANLAYLPAANPGTEAAGAWGGWPDCSIPARFNNQPTDPSVVFGCAAFPAPDPGSTHTGAVLQFAFQCEADGTTPITLVPHGGDPQAGSHFVDVNQAVITGTTLDPATVQCGSGAPSPPDTSIDSGPAEGSTTNDSTPTFGFSANPAAGATFECKVDLGSFAACTSAHTTAALGDGAHAFQVRAKDAVGNPDATPATRNFTVDTTPPDTSIDSGPAEGSTTSDTTPTFGFSANPAAGATFECKVDAGAFAACTSAHTTAALADGARTFQVRAINVNGTDATPATRNFTVDTTPPDTSITSGPAEGSTTNDSTPTFGFSANPAAGATFECKVD